MRSADWEWKTLGAQVAVARARQGLPGLFVDALMQADSLDTFWQAYIQFVVHVPNVSTIRDTNNHLRTNAGAHLVPNWAARYYDRIPRAPRNHRDYNPSPERTARDSRGQDRLSSRSHRKQSSSSTEERYVSLRVEGLLTPPFPGGSGSGGVRGSRTPHNSAGRGPARGIALCGRTARGMAASVPRLRCSPGRDSLRGIRAHSP